jgi:hypothetical protein
MNNAGHRDMCLDADGLPPTAYQLRLNADGIPTLNDVVEDRHFDEFAADIKAQLLTELEPVLQDLVQRAFSASIRMVALELKHSFEQELDKQLEARLHSLVEETVLRACHRARL